MQFNKITIIAVTAVLLLTSGIFAICVIDPWTNPNDRAYQKLVKSCKTCESAKAKAESDFNNNKLSIIHFGLPEGSGSFIEAEFLKKRFNINIIFGGCVVKSEMNCYNKRMIELTTNKFGLDTLNKTIREARKTGDFVDSLNYLKSPF